MIKIERTSAPSFLNPVPDPDIEVYSDARPRLHLMQAGKCCYCEKQIPDTGGDAQVEHFRPKSKPQFRHLTNDWTNLLLACGQCNNAKGWKFPTDEEGNPKLIDPSDPADDPERHLQYYVSRQDPEPLRGQIAPRDGSEKGKVTIETIKLDDVVHMKGRRAQLLIALDAINEIDFANTLEQKEAGIAKVNSLTSSNSPYAGITRYAEEIYLPFV